MKKKLLLFHTSLAPYRIDFFNAVNESFNASFYFDQKQQLDHSFGEYEGDYLENKCSFEPNYLSKGFKLLGRNFKTGLFGILSREKPDIVICYEYSPVTIVTFIFYLLKGKKFKMYSISDDSIENSKKRKGLRYLVRHLVARNVDGMIFPSREVCDWFRTHVSTSVKLMELPIIHEDEKFRKELSNSLSLANRNRKTYHLEDKRIILFVGRLIELKNLSFLLRVLSKLDEKDWRLIIVGDGNLRLTLERETEELTISDRVVFTGSLQGQKLLSWYALSEGFVLPSVFEQFGAVVNEALLAGCDVFCSKVAGAASLINKDNGRVFDPYLEDDLLCKIEHWLKNDNKPVNDFRELRNSQMPFTFNEKIKLLFDNIV